MASGKDSSIGSSVYVGCLSTFLTRPGMMDNSVLLTNDKGVTMNQVN